MSSSTGPPVSGFPVPPEIGRQGAQKRWPHSRPSRLGLAPQLPETFPRSGFRLSFLSNIGKSRRLSPNGDRIQDGQARPSDPPDSPESGRLRDFDRIIQICLDADPDKRFPDARALLDAIEEIC